MAKCELNFGGAVRPCSHKRSGRRSGRAITPRERHVNHGRVLSRLSAPPPPLPLVLISTPLVLYSSKITNCFAPFVAPLPRPFSMFFSFCRCLSSLRSQHWRLRPIVAPTPGYPSQRPTRRESAYRRRRSTVHYIQTNC